MKNKVLYFIVAIIFVISVVMTVAVGLKVDLYLGEGYTVKVSEKDSVDVNEIKQIAKEIWGNDAVVQKIEFFNDSVEIKVKDVDDEKLEKLKDKLNEKYSSELEVSSFNVEHVSNVKLRRIAEPYIIPLVLSLLLIMAFYAVRYRGARKMIELLLIIASFEVLLFSVYAIARLPVSNYTLPVAVALFIVVILINTFRLEITEDDV